MTIFGCSGFVARYVAQTLGRAGCQLVFPYRCDDTDVQHLRVMGDLGQVVMLPDFDVEDEEAIARAVHRSNVVVNCLGADQATWNYSLKAANADSAERIARVAAEAAPLERFVHFSALGAAPDAASERLRTKAAGEAAVREALGDKATVLRLAPVTGTEDRFLNAFARLVKSAPFVPIVGEGRQRVQPVWVRDVARAALETLHDAETAGKTYDLAGPKVYTINEILDLVYKVIREPDSRIPVPDALARLAAKPIDWMSTKTPIRTSGLYAGDRIEELIGDDLALPAKTTNGSIQDLYVEPMPIDVGMPIEFLRYYRVGGYEVGSIADESTVGSK